MSNTEYCLWLVMAFGAANPKIWELISYFGNPENAYNSLKSNSYNFLSEKEVTAVKTTHLEQSKYIMENCAGKDIKIICYYDENYPKQLDNIANPPIVLFVKGDLSVLNDLCITVVGTREPSAYSVRVAEKICAEMAKVGIVIISGFALGIDSVSHRSAIVNGGKTVAVLGCGIDVDYPKENTKSKSTIVRRGLFITEFLPGTKPVPSNFPKRNRVLSALGMGTLVIEAAQTSGSLITAELALEQGRDLFCIPPADIFDRRYSGVVKYLRDGAIPVFSHLDIIYEYYTAFTHKLSSINQNSDYSEPASESSVFSSEKKEKNKKIHTKKEDNKSNDKPSKENSEPEFNPAIYKNLDDRQMTIVNLLKDGVKYIDEITVMLDVPVPNLYLLLTEMELDGIIECLPGKAYKLA